MIDWYKCDFHTKKRVSLWWVTQMKRYFYNLKVPSNLWNVPYMRRLMPPSMERWWGFHILRYLEMEYVLRSEVNIWDWGSFCPVPLRNLISNNLRQSSIKTHVARHLQSPHFKMFYIRIGLNSSSRDFLNT